MDPLRLNLQRRRLCRHQPLQDAHGVEGIAFERTHVIIACLGSAVTPLMSRGITLVQLVRPDAIGSTLGTPTTPTAG